MKTLIVALPLFNPEIAVEAYWLNSRGGEKLSAMMDDNLRVSEALMTPGLDLVKTLGVEPLSGDSPLFVDINEYHLLMGIPLTLGITPEKLVCVLPGRIKTDDAVIAKCRELKDLGYGVAIDGLPEGDAENPLFELLDYIIVDTGRHVPDKRLIAIVANLSKAKKIVLSGITDKDMFNMLKSIPNTLFTGSFYRSPITKGAGDISPIKVNALTLLRQINEDDFELGDIAGTIGRDPSLSISLLRFINTIMPREINSIRGAVAILGQKEVKRWATAAISIQLAEDKPNEISKLSLIRARFAENLAGVFEMGVFAPSLFMMGLFSLLDIILDKPMAEAAKEVSLDEKVREALVDRSGEFHKVLELIYDYEHANWDAIAIKMVKYNLEVDEVVKAFIEALEWYKALLDTIGEEG